MFFNLTNNSIESIPSTKSYDFINLSKNYAFLLSKDYFNNNKFSQSLIYKSNNNYYKLISRNFLIELMNKCWRETIFLSITENSSDSYIEQLKSDGLSISSKDYKNFLSHFSKALINNRIKISSDKVKSNSKLKGSTNIYTRYIWKKGLNFSWPEKKSYLFSIFAKQLISASNNQLVEYLSINKLPIFTVINNLNQIILSESSNEILVSNNLIDRLYNCYSKYFLSDITNRIKYQALFFISPNDALEYKDYIKSQNNLAYEKKLMNLFTTRLDIYYNLMRVRMKYVDFRLIPDLEELGKLVSRYQYYRNIKLHKNQYCTKATFQGQPIYLIRPILAKNKITGKLELVKYFYLNDNYKDNVKYSAIFMNYKTSLLAWQKFRQQMFNYHLPIKPHLTVYNLESFIKTYDQDPSLSEKQILFVPSVESYFYLKNQINVNKKFSIIDKIINKFSYVKVFSQRMIWSLTSRQPVNL